MIPTDRPVATLIGDVVGSREAPDRGELHAHLVRGLRASEAVQPALEPLEVIAGDEFQAVYPDVGAAVLASLRVRLALAPDVDVRVGIGWGPVQVLDPSRQPVVQDGPGWWAARRAVEAAARAQRRPATRFVRTRFAPADGCDGTGGAPPAAWVDGLLTARDLLLDRLSPRSLRLLEGGLSDLTQTLMAEQEGITQSAVSQASARDGLAAIVDLHRSLLPHREDDEA